MYSRILSLLIVVLALGCSSNEKSGDSGGGGTSSGGSGNVGSSGKTSVGLGGQVHTGPMFAGAECPTDLGLPDAYALPNVKGQIEGANVRITFDPQADAADYRVYALPKKGDVSADGIQGAVYRCAGGGTVPTPPKDDEQRDPPPGARVRVASNVEGFDRTLDDATLGYVFTTPADDRIPVYALGDPGLRSDNTDCFEMRWPESRKKRYLTSKDDHDALVAKHWRDDGIVFYVPKPGADGTAVVHEVTQTMGEWSGYFYVNDGAELNARVGKGDSVIDAFSVYKDAPEGAEPLMRVYYALSCGDGHDELAAGKARFNHALLQGATPVTELHYSGLTEETTLVVEALDQQCTYQGTLAPTSRPARVDPFPMGEDVHYPAFQTFDELAATSPKGELFINGEADGSTPHAISRTCLKVKPEPAPQMDFFYDGSPEEFSDGAPRSFQIFDITSPRFDVTFYATATDEYAIGPKLGELWVTYADWAADTNGKVRMTPKTPAELSDDKFIHAQMEVDIVSSARRYPQLLVSSVKVPVQENLESGVTVVIQPRGGITDPMKLEIQLCDHRGWDVNNQCPMYELLKLKDASGDFLSPHAEPTGWMGVDRTVRFDAYVSTSRVYLYANTQPYACVDLPGGSLPAGTATVTFGDVLYHSGVDLEKWYPFHVAKMQKLTTRHFSNMGFSSKVEAPIWDEARLPCVPASGLK